MLIQDPILCKAYDAPHRLWQGIPGIAVTPGGRIYSTFYSGGTAEEIGNFAVLLRSEDGMHFSAPIAVAYLDENRCFDPCLWIDPLGRLWFTWAVMPLGGVYAAICEAPDAEVPVFSAPFLVGHGIMMNKPTVLSTGEWLFPIALWDSALHAHLRKDTERQSGAFAYRTCDGGKHFCQLGGPCVPGRSFDEHMFLETDAGLSCYVRTKYGIGVSYSTDGGLTWTEGEDSGLGGPDSRFHIRRLPSGRVLLVNHHEFTGRNNLTAFLSLDDGKTFPYRLLLDERAWVSYPDVSQGPDGSLYITYDRERGCFKHSLEEVYGDAREILYAKITEEDILAGRLVSKGSFLKRVISRLGKYEEEDKVSFS